MKESDRVSGKRSSAGAVDSAELELQLNNKMQTRDKLTAAQASSSTGYLVLLLLLASSVPMKLVARALETSQELNKPRITIQPNDLIVTEGESSELNCDAEGDPAPSIEWFHNGQPVTSKTRSRTTLGGSILFLDVKPASAGWQSDTGSYHCVARNKFGQATSRNASLQVAYIKREFKVAPKDKLATIGDTVTFECLPEAWPEPRIQWRHNGRLVEPNEQRLADGSAKHSISRIARTDFAKETASSGGSNERAKGNGDNEQNLVDSFGSQLVIKQVEKSDEGRYTCLVETKGSHKLIEHESPAAQLSALIKPYFIEAPEHKTVQVGGQARLRCRMGGDPEPVISWRKQNGQPLSEKAQIDPFDKTLILDKLAMADQATYICEGENSIGSARTMATISVTSRPKFTVQPKDQEVDLGSRVQIPCSGEANPTPMLFWYKEGHRQLMFAPGTPPAQSTPQTSPKQSLDWMSQAAPLMASDYRSSQSMTLASDISPSINKIFTMPITNDQPSPSSYSDSYFGNRIYVDNQGTLNIINVTSSDSGYYACAIISPVGSTMAKSKLVVRHSPSGFSSAQPDFYNSAISQEPSSDKSSSNSVPDNSRYELLPPPVIKLGAANQTLPTNTSAILVCEVVSQVEYKIQWFFESLPLHEDPSRVIVLETGALSISNLRPSDSGTYTCVVTAANVQMMPLASPFEPLYASMLTTAPPIQQSTSHSTILKVASPMNPNIQFYKMDTFAYPSSPGPAYLVSTNDNDAITIAWAPPADSGSLPIKEYIVEHYDTSQEYRGWKEIYRTKGKESLLIGGLSADGSHFFVIRAANSHGAGPSSAIAGPMRTVSGEARYQLEVSKRKNSLDSKNIITEIPAPYNQRPDSNIARERLMTISTSLYNLTPKSSTTIRLQWAANVTGNLSGTLATEQLAGINFPLLSVPDVSDFLEGFSIRFRAIGIGESFNNKDSLLGSNWNIWNTRDPTNPSSLPLVTSYLDGSDDISPRNRRDLVNYVDYSQEFSEVKVVGHSIDHYTINDLKPFTLYQFFVVPFYKDIDGVPSNILTAQTHEDRPPVAPPNLTVRPINSTAVRLLWIHVPPLYSNGILRGYTLRINRSDVLDGNGNQPLVEPPRTLDLPLASLIVTPLTTNAYQSNAKSQPNIISAQQYVVMYDLTNLTYKSFYSVQISASTSIGSGPWSEPQNFIMDPKILSQLTFSGTDFDDVLSKSLISTAPQNYETNGGLNSLYITLPVTLVLISIFLVAAYLLYRRNNQRVITWKKTISEHFANKFYIPSTVDSRDPSNSIQQNVYGHQQHLIYTAAPHIAHQNVPSQTMWSVNGCMNTNGTGSLSSHGGLIPISTDPNNLNHKINGEQVLLMNSKANDQRFAKNFQGQLLNQPSIESPQSMIQQNQMVHHGDYYSVINNMAEYEELESSQRGNMQVLANADRHQTASSNSDTSCPSSVTRLIPAHNYNRELINKTFSDNQRHEMILQQQVSCNMSKQPFATMINNEASRLQSVVPLSPYATTNLMNQGSQQLFANHQMSLIDQSKQQNFVTASGGLSINDTSKILINQQPANSIQTPVTLFRTLQRHPISFQSRGQHQFGQALTQSVNSGNYSPNQYQSNQIVANITSNPVADLKSNLYDHIDYSDSSHHQQLAQQNNRIQHHSSQVSNDMISSSTSSGSMKSSSQHQSPDQQTNLNRFRRGSNGAVENEAHDLHVFSSQQATRQAEPNLERQRAGNSLSVGENGDDDSVDADETTAFRQKTSQSDNQRTRQLSKRKRQQQRNRLHNNNQSND